MDIVDRLQEARRQQQEQATQRYSDSAGLREQVGRRLAAGEPVVGAEPELVARASRLARGGHIGMDELADVAQAEAHERPQVLERILGASNDLCAVSFLPRGARSAATVARISLAVNGRELPSGTGFLVSPRLLMTNHHVLPDTDVVASAFVEFGAEVDIDNQPVVPSRFRLDAATFFVTDEHLDVSLVAVTPNGGGRLPGELYGWNRLIAQKDKILPGEAVNIVGHPSGRRKEVSIRNNRLVAELPEFLQYETDTEPGNSGSPVFNDQWEVVALHHAGVPRKDADGHLLRKDGKVWQPGDGDDAVDWIANEGIRVSVLLAALRALALPPTQAALLAELGRDSGLLAPAAPEPTADIPQPVQDEALGRRHGLIGRLDAFGDLHLVFLHGIRQQGRDPVDLRQRWTAALNAGLTLSGLGTIDPGNVSFPFYGDVLAGAAHLNEALLPTEALQPWETTHQLTVPTDPDALAVYTDLVRQAARAAGMPPELMDAQVAEQEGLFGIGAGLVGALRGQLGWLAARSGLDSAFISLAFKDVSAYLGDEKVRSAVLAAVQESLPTSGRMVLVGHSLGTVVAMDVLHRLPADVPVPTLVTLGSPLGMDAVYNRLLTRGPARPGNVGRWLNVFAPADPVAIGCPLHDDWHGQLDEQLVTNVKDKAHDIDQYLMHPEVAAQIRRALT